jgi:hypothetical protein
MDMSGKVSIIGLQIKHITKQYRELQRKLGIGKDIEVYIEETNRNIVFIRNVLAG